MEMFKYTVECDSIYNVVAFFIMCTLLGFISVLLYKGLVVVAKLIQYIVNKVTKYKSIHTKAQYKDTSLEVDLHERDRMGTE